MKRIMMVLMFITLVGFITACGNNQNTENDEIDQQDDDAIETNSTAETPEQTDDSDSQEYKKSKMEALPFVEFNLEVEYANNQEYEAEIDQHKNEWISANVEDELNNVFLQGREAFDEIYPRIETLDVSMDSDQTELITQTLEAFDLPTDYKKFELEVEFNDGRELEIEDKK